MNHESDQKVHEDEIIPDGSTDNQDDARMNVYFEELKEWEKKRRIKKEKQNGEKLKEKKTEKEVAEEVL